MPVHSSARTRLLVAVAALAFPAPLAAQHEHARADSAGATTLAPITVVGARAPSVAPPVETIEVSAEQLHQAPASGPYDLVRRTAGIEVHEQGQGPGFASDAVIRGFTSDHSSDVLLVIDGVPINLPLHGHVEGYADWSLLTPASLGSLRVIHGPSSPLYGDFAFGGVVEAITADDADGTSGVIRGSSYGDAGGWVRTGYRAPTSGGLLALDGERRQGWRDNSDYWLGNAVAHGWKQAGQGRLTGGAMLYGSTWDSPGFVSVARYNDDDLEAATDPTDGGYAGRLILHGHYHRPVGDNVKSESAVWTQGVRSHVFLNIPHDGVVAQTEEEDRRVAVGGDTRLTWQLGTGEITVGASGRADWTRYDLYDTESRVRESQDQSNDGRYHSGAAYLRWRGLVAQRIAYDVGGRLDLLHYASLDRLTAGGAWQDETRLLASPKLGARYLLNDRIALLASLARGFRGAVGTIGDPSRHPVDRVVQGGGRELPGPARRGAGRVVPVRRGERADPRSGDPRGDRSRRERPPGRVAGAVGDTGRGTSAGRRGDVERRAHHRRGDGGPGRGDGRACHDLAARHHAGAARRAAGTRIARSRRRAVYRPALRRGGARPVDRVARHAPVLGAVHPDRRAERADAGIRRRRPGRHRSARPGRTASGSRPAERVRREVPGAAGVGLPQPRRPANAAARAEAGGVGMTWVTSSRAERGTLPVGPGTCAEGPSLRSG